MYRIDRDYIHSQSLIYACMLLLHVPTATVHAKNLEGQKEAHAWRRSAAVASLVDLVGSAAIFAGGSPTTGVSLDITVAYLSAARANVRD